MSRNKTVHIKYFALLREERGLAAESIDTEADDLAQLYDEVRARYSFSLPVDRMAVAVNDEFANWSDRVEDQAVIVFVPPVAGG
ncbi:MAG: MoaD/ThiS family protein [Candidatus Obscuribacterales bacterium]|nr:MoaD/ThiS family protein [Candidatus Obscuribacterales bacterium]